MSVIDDFLENIDGAQKAELERVRKIIKRTVPEAEEAISYGIPAFRYRGKYLIAFAPFKNHMSIFPGAAAVEKFKGKLSGYKLSKGTIQFTLDKPLSDKLIVELVSARLGAVK